MERKQLVGEIYEEMLRTVMILFMIGTILINVMKLFKVRPSTGSRHNSAKWRVTKLSRSLRRVRSCADRTLCGSSGKRQTSGATCSVRIRF